MNRILAFALPACSLGLLLAQQSSTPSPSADLFREISMRNILGTFTSGRIADVAVDPKNRNIWYVATASGGLWKTTNRGVNFQPVFDEGGSYSLGCVTVDPKNSDIVWLGTGENDAQRAIGWGDGLYKSTDAGKTWKNMGLAHSEHIAKIMIDARDSNTVYVAAQGPLFSPGGDRGLYKTTDGGATWKPLLQITENTGITDLAIDPRNPDVMYAAAYQRRRNTSVIVAGGPDAGIFKTTDGGKNWKKLSEGLPPVDLGRIALALSPQKPDILYALIMTARGNKLSGYYRSDDAGDHWTRGAYKEVQDPEYYGEIYADPFVFDRVYAMDMAVFVTQDGGKTVTNGFGVACAGGRGGRGGGGGGGGLHSDNHALVFDPTDENHLIEGNDGGLYESYDHGCSWRHFNNIPVTQFYRVSVDNGLPFYNIYGGTQDNGSQGVPTNSMFAGSIRTSEWMNTGGGDGYQSRADQVDPSIVYTCSQMINCVRLDLKTGQSSSINPRAGRGGGRGGNANTEPPPGKINDPKLRDRWDIPFIISPHNHTRLYIMGSKLMQSDDSGANWKEVSDDLTRAIDRDTVPVMGKVWPNETAVWKNEFTDQYGTGTAIAESPLKEGLLFVGTDDGLVQISEDGSKTWRKVDKWPGVPDMTYVTDVHPSPLAVNTVFVTLNDFQRGNFKPYVMKSTDLGRTWTSVTGDLPNGDPAWSVVQDHINPNLLFVGTEFGLSFSIDGGQHWNKIHGMPPTPIRDLEIQKRESDLAAASFGRGFFILDDYSALRQLTPQVLSSEGALLAPGRKARAFDELNYYRAQGDNIGSPNPPFGAILSYYLRDDMPAGGADAPRLVLQIADAGGKIVRQMDAPSAKAGLHRTTWDLRETPAQGGGGRGGNFAAPADAAAGDQPPAGGADAAAAGRGGRAGGGGGGGGGGRGGGRGPMVKPGTYTVTFGKMAGGNLTPIGQPQKVEVVPLEASNR